MILEWPKDARVMYARRRMARQRRRTRDRGQYADMLASQWLKCLKWWGEQCCYCQRHADECGQLTVDHFHPLELPNSPGLIVSNVLPACDRCNSDKSGQEPHQWITDTFGNKAPAIEARIEDYFRSVTK